MRKDVELAEHREHTYQEIQCKPTRKKVCKDKTTFLHMVSREEVAYREQHLRTNEYPDRMKHVGSIPHTISQ